MLEQYYQVKHLFGIIINYKKKGGVITRRYKDVKVFSSSRKIMNKDVIWGEQ